MTGSVVVEGGPKTGSAVLGGLLDLALLGTDEFDDALQALDPGQVFGSDRGTPAWLSAQHHPEAVDHVREVGLSLELIAMDEEPRLAFVAVQLALGALGGCVIAWRNCLRFGPLLGVQLGSDVVGGSLHLPSGLAFPCLPVALEGEEQVAEAPGRKVLGPEVRCRPRIGRRWPGR